MNAADKFDGKRDGLTLESVAIALAGQTLLRVDAHVVNGSVLTIMGPSGSGKSSLLSFLGGFLDPAFSAAGQAFINGADLLAMPPEMRGAGLLFQDPLLFPHMSVGQNLLFALPPDIKGDASRRAMADSWLEKVDMAGMFDRDPDTLSGGQKARVALARVLMSKPRFLLLDEPFSKLDVALRAQIRSLVFQTAHDNLLPVILVTHDPDDAPVGGQLINLAGH